MNSSPPQSLPDLEGLRTLLAERAARETLAACFKLSRHSDRLEADDLGGPARVAALQSLGMLRADREAFALTPGGGYLTYAICEWQHYWADPARWSLTDRSCRRFGIRHVLDLGCGAGQELCGCCGAEAARCAAGLRAEGPAAPAGALRVGIDISPLATRVAAALRRRPAGCTFATAAAERLPFATATFDLVLCRVTLPYTDNAAAVGEIARVLRPGGIALLKYHHRRFYLGQLAAAVRARHLRHAIEALMVLGFGACYRLSGRQPRLALGRHVFSEIDHTSQSMRRLAQRHGLAALEEYDAATRTPMLLLRRS